MQPLRYLDDAEYGQTHNNMPYTEAGSGNLTKKVKQVAGSFSGHTFSIYGSTGDLVKQGEKDEIDSYYFYKGSVLAVEFAWFLYFLAFGFGAFATVVVEVDYGSGWLISLVGMYSIIGVFTGVGALLLLLYIFFCVKFMHHGDEQLDELLSNVLAIGTMYFVLLGLLVKFFVFNDTDNDNDDLNFRRLLYTVFTGYGIFGMVIIIKAITRHMTIAKEVMINYQTWRASPYNEGIMETKVQSKGTIYAVEYNAKPHKRIILFMFVMWISTAIILALSVWLLFLSVGSSAVPDFGIIYMVTAITMGTTYVVLTLTWISWSFMSVHYKACFTSHFDVFYATHAIYLAVVCFMLIGYRYTYWYVPDTFFESPGVTVPALKLAYFNKISILQFIMLPLLAMGIGKGVCLMANEYPVDLKKYQEEVKRQKDSKAT